jgi:NADP-dependent 3-hydroxy acid dehydrogenase YdfG
MQPTETIGTALITGASAGIGAIIICLRLGLSRGFVCAGSALDQI